MSNFVELKNNLPVSEIGGKAYSLSVLLKNGFNVPRGFVVTSSAFFDFSRYNDLLERIQKLASEITEDNFKEKSAQAKDLILKGQIPGNIASEINGFLNRLGAKYVSIRSSAVSEDSLKASFAGQFDTFLNIKADSPLVLENVKRCWASLFNERAIAYRLKKGIPHSEGIAVVVQAMIAAQISGIIFTVHPTDEKRLLVEASYGIGDIVVGGNVEPDDFTVDRNALEIVERKIGKKNKMSIIENKEIKLVNVRRELHGKQVLPDDKIKEIAEIGLKVERIFNYPQDIEWCLFNSKLWLLQSRAITGQTK